MTDTPRKPKNETLQIAKQASETQKQLAQLQQQADQARRSPPPIMGSNDPLRSLFSPQMS